MRHIRLHDVTCKLPQAIAIVGLAHGQRSLPVPWGCEVKQKIQVIAELQYGTECLCKTLLEMLQYFSARSPETALSRTLKNRLTATIDRAELSATRLTGRSHAQQGGFSSSFVRRGYRSGNTCSAGPSAAGDQGDGGHGSHPRPKGVQRVPPPGGFGGVSKTGPVSRGGGGAPATSQTPEGTSRRPSTGQTLLVGPDRAPHRPAQPGWAPACAPRAPPTAEWSTRTRDLPVGQQRAIATFAGFNPTVITHRGFSDLM